MYDVPSRTDIATVRITREVVEDNVNPTLVPRKPSRRERGEKTA
jgi:ATP-dependent Clp protease ATP-binding subunit ClpX